MTIEGLILEFVHLLKTINKVKSRGIAGVRGITASDSKYNYFSATITINGVNIFLKKSKNLEDLKTIIYYAKSYSCKFYPEYNTVPIENIPQWIKDKIDKKLKDRGATNE